MPDDLASRVDFLERLQAQQARLNDLLIEVTDRLSAEQSLHAARLLQHAEHMARLDALLAAIKDLLERGNGH